MKRLIRLLLRIAFRFRAYNEGVLSAPGPVMLLPNHVSWFDWLLLAVCLDDDWCFVTSSQVAQTSWLHRLIMVNHYTFPAETESPYAIKRIAEYLQSGGRLVLFPEGRLSRTGSLMKLFDGTGLLLFKTNARVITCYLRGAHRLPLSPNPNWKQWFPRVTAHFSDVFTPPTSHEVSTTQARGKLTRWLYDTMVQQQFDIDLAATPKTILAAIIETAQQRPNQIVLQDVSHEQLTYRRLLAGVDAMARQWEKWLSTSTGEHVGVLLPNTNAMPVTILSLWSVGKVPAILNYSIGVPTMLACAQLAGMKHIITSKTFLDRAKLNVQSLVEAGIEFIYLEDVRASISKSQQLRALIRVSLNPQSAIRNPQSSEAAVILFTSGSEGPPKAVELTHANLIANVRQMLSVIDLVDTDRLFNALPLFHSFGLTAGLLLPLMGGVYTFLYPSPLHYRVIPNLLYDLDCTILFGTNTFLIGYARKAHSYDFRTLRYLFAGAEKLQEATANTWARRFGVRILEGYGATECSPCVTVNTLVNPRFGSAGKFMPGMEYKLEPVEGVEEGGRLRVRGPNVMRGYLNPDANATFQALGGWYDTGDIARVDDDGFIYILGRLKRFAKVSGEMVSLTAVEEALAGAFPHYGVRCQIAILSRPDVDRGEALVAVSNESKLQMEELRAAIKAKGLSNLCVPREIKFVHDIPKLGTGKVNHPELQKLIEGSQPA